MIGPYGELPQEEALEPIRDIRGKIRAARMLWNAATNFVLTTVSPARRAHGTILALTRFRPDQDWEALPGDGRPRIGWWSGPSRHNRYLQDSGFVGSATILNSLATPANQADGIPNVGVNVETLRVREVTDPDEIDFLLGSFNDFRGPRGYERREVGEFAVNGLHRTRRGFIWVSPNWYILTWSGGMPILANLRAVDNCM